MSNKPIIILLTLVTIMTLTATYIFAVKVFSYDKAEELAFVEEIKENELINIEHDESADILYEEDTIFGDEFSGEYSGEYESEIVEEIITDIEEIPVNKPTSSKPTKVQETPVSKATVSSKYNMPYYIKINRTQNVVNIYTRDDEGNYTIPFKAMVCSTGTSTPKAGTKYKITTYRREWNGLKGGVYGQYAVQIVGNILFHSVPYTAKDKSALEYWEYDKLGTKASLGCIRLAVKDVKWIYDNIGAGTIVEFYEDEDPGPLGKPSAQKISDNEECRNWDPTDYVEGNPWHTTIDTDEEEILDEIEEMNNTISGETTNVASSGEQVKEENIVISEEVNVDPIEENTTQTIESNAEEVVEETVMKDVNTLILSGE